MISKDEWAKLGESIGAMVGAKNEAYGDAIVNGTVKILEVLFPNGISPEQYSDLPLMVVMINKMLRISRGDKNAFEESPYKDLAGYSLIGYEKESQKVVKNPSSE